MGEFGSRESLELWRAEVAAQDSHSTGPVARCRAAHAGSLLLAENDAPFARALSLRLRHGGWAVEVVRDGESALRAVEHGGHDVLLLDLRLPNVDGLQVLQQLGNRAGGPAVILMSGYLDLENTMAAIRFGAVEVLEKPVAPQYLCDVLSDVVRGRRAQRAQRTPSACADVTEIIGDSNILHMLREQLLSVAPFRDLSVLVIGETGTGKELVAGAIHRLSAGAGPLLAVNCAAIPEPLFESELFGHAAGSFTDAKRPREGLLEAAGDGTVFLDEVGELPRSMQAKLLRVLETRRFRPVGGNRELKLRARIVSATNRDLAGKPGEALRSDLYFRLAGYVVRTPPLRERMEDIAPLARHFLSDFTARHAVSSGEISEQALCALHTHDWPGNVRELRAVLMSATVRARGRIEVRHVLEAMGTRVSGGPTAAPNGVIPRAPHTQLSVRARTMGEDSTYAVVSERGGGLPAIERELVARAYAECDGNLTRAARKLRVPRTTLRDRVKRYGLR